MQSIRDFFSQKRRKIIIAACIGGTAYFAYKRLTNTAKAAVSQQKSADYRLRSYFDDSQRTCSAIVTSLAPSMYEKIANFVEIPLPAQLRNCQTKEEKKAMWEKLEFQTFTRTLAAMYSVVLITLFLRVQINLVGRYLYRDQVEQGTSYGQDSEPIFGDKTQEKYLAYTDYFVQHGMPLLCTYVQEACRTALATWPVSRSVTFDDLLVIFIDIRRSLDSSPSSLLESLLPPESYEQEEDSKLTMLLGETRNILEGAALQRLFKQCLDYSFLPLIQNMRTSFTEEVADTSSQTLTFPIKEQGEVSGNAGSPAVSDDKPNIESVASTISVQESKVTSTPIKVEVRMNEEFSGFFEGGNETSISLPKLVTLPMARVIPIIKKQFNIVLQTPYNDFAESLSQFRPLNDFSYSVFTQK